MSSPAWAPVLSGATAARAQRVLDQLAHKHQRWLAAAPREADDLVHAALFFATAAGRVELEVDYGDLLGKAIEAAGATPRAPRLWGGSVGFAFSLDRTLDALHAEAGEVLGEFEATLGAGPDQFDLVRGQAGWLVYLLGRPRTELTRAALVRVIDFLESRALPVSGAGLTWLSPDDPERVDVGLAHGMAGVAGALALALGAGVEGPRVTPLLDGVVDWLLTQRGRAPGACAFPAFVFGSKCKTARLAWCYGDPGVAAALWLAASARGNPLWRAAALETALHATTISLADSHVEDAGLCHGATGLGLVFARFFNATGDERFRAASERWVVHALELFDVNAPLGYRALHPSDSGALVPVDDPSFLMGTAGIGLCLLAATGHDEPRWDSALLTSPPPVPR